MSKIICIIIVLLAIPQVLFSQDAKKLKKIVIDPGHGGKKPGAVGKKSKEKDITLLVSLKLGKVIKDNFKDVEVLYTRTTDDDVDLYKRAQIANKAKADLFLSIHVNSTKNKDATGFETFVMGLSKSSANLEVAKKENADILLEDDYKDNPNYQGFDPNSPESSIMFALYQNAYLKNSSEFSAEIQKQYHKNIKSINRGVKQAEFFVLYKTAMPSVLTEIGFISNEKEEEFLNTEQGQIDIVTSLANAFNNYKATIEGSEPLKTLVVDIPSNFIKKEEIKSTDSLTKGKDSIRVVQKEEPVKKEEIKTDTNKVRKVVVNDTKQSSSQGTNKSEAKKSPLEYRVQFFVSKQKLSLSDKKFNGLDGVQMYEYEGLYRYTIGNEPTIYEAKKIMEYIKSKNFTDAFIVAFYENKRITLQDALKISQNEGK